MLYVVNYAEGEPFESYRKINSRTAKWFGKADRVIEYSYNDIPLSYREAHKEIFAYKRGAGLWLWKPYIINKALNEINDGDWLFYTDSGAIFIDNIHKMIPSAIKANSDIMLFEQPLLHRQFTKKETMVNMGVAEIGSNQTLGIMLIRKTPFTKSLISEWLINCENEMNISPNHYNDNIVEFEDFVSHREDQSILSTLRIKYNIVAFRDPSDYGEMPFLYCFKNIKYNPKVYSNSNYPTILLCSRNTNPYKYLCVYLLRKFFLFLNVLYTAEKRIKNPPVLPQKK